MQEQSRILLTLRYLYEKTDPDHLVTSRQIKRMLENNGIKTPVSRTIDSDVDQLIAAGYNIVRTHQNGSSMHYHIASREFDTLELQILVDAIAASRFISVDRSKKMIGYLASMACITDRAYLMETLEHVRSIKKAAGGTLYYADAIFQAVIAKKQIRFCLTEHHIPYKTIVSQKRNVTYLVSPYATLWCNDHYYLVAYDEKQGIMITPRLDHIRKVKILTAPVTPRPRSFDLGFYYSAIEKMNNEEKTTVTIECENHMQETIALQFGDGSECTPVTDHSFQASIDTCIDSSFFGWLIQHAEDATLVGPAEAVKAYKDHLKKAAAAMKILRKH